MPKEITPQDIVLIDRAQTRLHEGCRQAEDLHREHVAHEHAMDARGVHLGALTEAHGTDLSLRRFIRGLDDLASELALHIRPKDEELFPLFATPTSAGGPSTSNPRSCATSTS